MKKALRKIFVTKIRKMVEAVSAMEIPESGTVFVLSPSGVSAINLGGILELAKKSADLIEEDGKNDQGDLVPLGGITKEDYERVKKFIDKEEDFDDKLWIDGENCGGFDHKLFVKVPKTE